MGRRFVKLHMTNFQSYEQTPNSIMFHKTLLKTWRWLALVFSFFTVCIPVCPQSPPAFGTTPFVLDGNRMYAELGFVRPDGSVHKALAFVDMGSPTITIASVLFKDLQLGEKRPLLFRVGDMAVQVPAAEVTSDASEPYSIGSDLKVEAILPAGVLQRFEVKIDYRASTITLAQPGKLRRQGVAVPFHRNEETGLIAVDAIINGRSYAMTIDNGSAYTWFRQSTVKEWLVAHPDWERGVGAVGVSNMMMSSDNTETSGILVRIPEIKIGSMNLKEVGALGAGPGRGFGGNLTLFDWYSTKNAVPVIGWIGGNVLKNFRLTIDYANRTLYWLKQTEPGSQDLDQVGLTLRFQDGDYTVAAIATKNGKPTVEGVQVADKLLQVDTLQLKQASWGAIYSALQGKPGDVRILILERAGNQVTVNAKVTAF